MENLMRDHDEVLAYLNSAPPSDGSCARCHAPGDHAHTEICEECHKKVYADCYDDNGNWVG